MITLQTRPGDKLIELGGGAQPQIRPNVDVRQCYDTDGNPTVDFTANFDEPLPIQSDEFDGVFSRFVIEHVCWRKVRQFVAEVFRILKPGGKAVFVTANTEAQVKYILSHPEGWEGRTSFESFSCILFGDQDYPENTHKNWMSPAVASQVFQEAGFQNSTISPYGALATDMVIEAVKPAVLKVDGGVESNSGVPVKNLSTLAHDSKEPSVVSVADTDKDSNYFDPARKFDRDYFENYFGPGQFYWDHPRYQIAADKVLKLKPESVLELGCGRGYILKRLEDAGVACLGFDCSQHAVLTRVSNVVNLYDILIFPWSDVVSFPWAAGSHQMTDLCLAVDFIDHLPTAVIPVVLKEMARTCKRGLVAVNKENEKTWRGLFQTHIPGWPVEVVSLEEFWQGDLSHEVRAGDGKLKINVGSYVTMFHHGWNNVDVHDLKGFADAYGYKYLRHDVRKGLPFSTDVVDLILCSHFLEHLTYEEGLKFLKECRRVLRHDVGCLRLAVPDADQLTRKYTASGGISLSTFDEVNGGCKSAPTPLGKLWALLHDGHQAAYDFATLQKLLVEAGFCPGEAEHRVSCWERTGFGQILRETTEMSYGFSLFVDAMPQDDSDPDE